MTRGGANGGPDTRASVSAKRLRRPASGTNCLGRARRESGHSRVPLPPESTTGRIAAPAAAVFSDMDDSFCGIRYSTVTDLARLRG